MAASAVLDSGTDVALQQRISILSYHKIAAAVLRAEKLPSESTQMFLRRVYTNMKLIPADKIDDVFFMVITIDKLPARVASRMREDPVRYMTDADTFVSSAANLAWEYATPENTAAKEWSARRVSWGREGAARTIQQGSEFYCKVHGETGTHDSDDCRAIQQAIVNLRSEYESRINKRYNQKYVTHLWGSREGPTR